jgi:hypothetical protein
MFFYALLFLMALGDVLWCRAALRQPHRWVRWTAATFGVVQFMGMAAILFSRGGPPLDEAIPRWMHSIILAWHLVILLPWMIWRSTRGIVALAVGIFRARRPAVPTTAKVTGITRRDFIGAAAAFTPPLLSIGAAAIGEAQLDGFRIRRLEVPLAALPPALDGMTIAHVSDFHVGRFTRGRVLERIVEETNRLDADVVALTGDFINHSLRDLPAAVEIVRALRARHIIAGCEGNHDLIENPQKFRREAERGGIPLLLGDVASTTIRGQRVQLLGIPWARGESATRKEIAALLARRNPAAWPLLLAHHPHAWDSADGIPLTLSGHTHGGQLMLNERLGAGPVLFRYWTGLYTRPGSTLVVSNGVGNWFPVRMHAPAEILHLTLRKA